MPMPTYRHAAFSRFLFLLTAIGFWQSSKNDVFSNENTGNRHRNLLCMIRNQQRFPISRFDSNVTTSTECDYVTTPIGHDLLLLLWFVVVVFFVIYFVVARASACIVVVEML